MSPFISVKKNSIVVVGGIGAQHNELSSIEVISSDQTTRTKIEIPRFPKQIHKCHLFIQDGVLMAAGGFNWSGSFNESCYQLKNGIWKINTKLKTKGYCTPDNLVITSKAIYTFGADKYSKIVRYLPTNSKNWRVEKNSKIPGYFVFGCAVEVKSKGEIWLIGGCGERGKIILSFDLQNHTFKELPMKLLTGRSSHKCIVTKIGDSEVILVTGGVSEGKESHKHVQQNSVEIINITEGSVTSSSPMNSKRNGHGIGILDINNQPRIAVFGGWNGNDRQSTIEVFDQETLKWEFVKDYEMAESRSDFGYFTI